MNFSIYPYTILHNYITIDIQYALLADVHYSINQLLALQLFVIHPGPN